MSAQMHICSCGERYFSLKGAIDCERSHVKARGQSKNTELRRLLMDCAEKLNFYRAQHSGEYVGGVEYTELQRRIVAALTALGQDQPDARK